MIHSDIAAVLGGGRKWAAVEADGLTFLRSLPDDCCDLIFTSPPYEAARLYLENGADMKIARDTEAWVKWLLEIWHECRRVCTGLVAFVVEGQTRKYRYSAGPLLLAADLHRAGFNLRKPPVFHRVGIPGSGGPDWLRNDYEFVICTTRPGKLPWSDNTALGHPPKWAPGGAMSHRVSNGSRVNQWGNVDGTNGTTKGRATRGHANGDVQTLSEYAPPAKANPGNVIHCKVGGGLLGSPLAHENEAPFPESLVTFFAFSFCKPGGIVCDPFVGSGTTAAVAVRNNRRFIGCDLRASQVELTRRRVEGVTPLLLTEGAEQ